MTASTLWGAASRTARTWIDQARRVNLPASKLSKAYISRIILCRHGAPGQGEAATWFANPCMKRDPHRHRPQYAHSTSPDRLGRSIRPKPQVAAAGGQHPHTGQHIGEPCKRRRSMAMAAACRHGGAARASSGERCRHAVALLVAAQLRAAPRGVPQGGAHDAAWWLQASPPCRCLTTGAPSTGAGVRIHRRQGGRGTERAAGFAGRLSAVHAAAWRPVRTAPGACGATPLGLTVRACVCLGG